MTDVKKLRELAEMATPGPWELRIYQSGTVYVGMKNADAPKGEYDRGYLGAHITLYNVADFSQSEEDLQRERYHNGEFIAAANPQAIIELLDRLERYERVLRDIGTYHSHDSLIQSVFDTAREALEGGKGEGT